MAARRGGLGKGLEALIPGAEGAELQQIPVDQIEPNRFQPREHFDGDALDGLTASVRELGILQPLLVRPASRDGRYELIAGERRWRAARAAGLSVVPAVIRPTEDRGSLERALVENLQHEDLNPLEEAAAYQQLIDDFSLTQEELASRVSRSRSAVANTLRLLHLPPSVLELVADGQLSAGAARALLGTDDRKFQVALAQRAAKGALSVREVEKAVRERVDGPQRPSRRPRADRPAALLELEEMLAEHLSTPVKVSMGTKKGRFTVDFATLDDLERISRLIVGT